MGSKYLVSTNQSKAEEMLRSKELSHAQIADTLLFLRKSGYAPAKLMDIMDCKDYTIRYYTGISKNLIDPVKALLHSEKLTFSHARAIAPLPPREQEEAARSALMHHTSVHAMRNKLKGRNESLDDDSAKYFERLADKLGQQTGLMLSIKPDTKNKHAGTMVLRYTDLRDFDAICSRLRVDLTEL